MHLANTAALLFLLVAQSTSEAQAQPNCFQTFQPCLDANQQFFDTTCLPLQTRNFTHYQACRCYHFVNVANCYPHCPNDPTVQAQLAGSVQPQITAECTAANLNPKALPQPAPWQTWVAPPPPPKPAAQTTAAGAAAAASTAPATDGTISTSTGSQPAKSAAGAGGPRSVFDAMTGSLALASGVAGLLLATVFAR
ncbi:hypothetical protein BC831DRAFT_434039 [Entophlyctis helioformis]|nr:hypothetical protein BC831DRAFT_434039 [Entophlyctis helioformis]